MFNNIGPGEVVFVLIVLIVLFGGKKLPEIARGLGESAKELKKVKIEIEHALNDVKSEDDEKKKGGELDNA